MITRRQKAVDWKNLQRNEWETVEPEDQTEVFYVTGRQRERQTDRQRDRETERK